MIECRLLERPEAVASLGAEWDRLFAGAQARHVFQSYAWFECWAAVFGPGKAIRVAAFYNHGRLVGVAPAMVVRTWRGPKLRIGYDLTPDDLPFVGVKGRYRWLPVRQLTFPCGLEASNVRGQLLCADGYREQCEEALAREWAAMPGWDLAVLSLPSSAAQSLCRIAESHGLPTQRRPAHRQFRGIELAPWEAYLESRSRQFRKTLRQADRAGAGLQCSVVAGRESADALETLYAIAARSWKNHGRESERDHLPLTDRTRTFYRRLCATTREDIVPVVALLRQEASPIGAMLALMSGERLFGCITYFDPAAAAVSPGRHLLRAVYRWSIAHGARYFDLNGESRFNEYFANHAEAHDQLLIFNRTAYGRALHWLAGLLHRTDATHGDTVSIPGH